MLARLFLLAGLLLVTGCAYDDDYYDAGYPSPPPSALGPYSNDGPANYGSPYQPGSPVYGAPYVNGPVAGVVYVYGDSADYYGGPVFAPYQGIRCDRRFQTCWGRNGPDPHWSGRFFGHRQQRWGNGNGGNGGWGNGNWNHGNSNWNGNGVPWGNKNGTWPRQSNNQGGGNHQGGGWGNHGGWQNHGPNPGGPNQGGPNPSWPHQGGPNPGGNNNRPYVYQVPKNPDGRGTPTFLPNGCGNGQPCP